MTRSVRWCFAVGAFVALSLAAVGYDLVLIFVVTEDGAGSAARFVPAVALAVAQGGAALATYRWVRAGPLAVVVAGAALALLYPDLGASALSAANVTLCVLAIRRTPRDSIPVLAVNMAVQPALALNAGDGTLGVAVGVLGPLASWFWGELVRTRSDRRKDLARRAVEEERVRIARELHDVVAHNVSVIVVQAAAADDVFDLSPGQARVALRAIEASGRAALVELRRLLDTVRPDEPGDRGPQPGLADLDTLTASMRAAGLPVALREEGDAVPVPAGVGLSAYRIVQEALTNTLRHARATRADVVVRYLPGALEIDVRDDGAAAGTPSAWQDSGGHGIVGMRERAALLGGTLEAAPMERGGFRVAASLPLGKTA